MIPLAPNTISQTQVRPVLTTSQQWILPPRTKPGRKKKGTPASVDAIPTATASKSSAATSKSTLSQLEIKIQQLEKLAAQREQENIKLQSENVRLNKLIQDKARKEQEYETIERLASHKRPRRSTRTIIQEEAEEDDDSADEWSPILPSSLPSNNVICSVCHVSTLECYCKTITFAAPVALPLRLKSSVTSKSIWSIKESSSTATCSGDPSTCPACSDDPFAKAFCSALSTSVCSANPCSSCPNAGSSMLRSLSPEVDEAMYCCGNSGLCGNACLAVAPVQSDISTMREKEVEMVPCNEAWSELRSHRNIGFANLQMLADVVARRTHCEGMNVDERAKRLTVEKSAINDGMSYLDRSGER